MEFTTFLVYLALKLDDIIKYLQSGGIWFLFDLATLFYTVACIAMIVMCLVYNDVTVACKKKKKAKKDDEVNLNDEDLEELEEKNKLEHNIVRGIKANYGKITAMWMLLVGLTVFTSMAGALLPSTKQALTLVTVDIAIKNKDEALKTGKDIMEIVDSKVEKYLRIVTGSEVKEAVQGAADTVKETGKAITDTVKSVKDGVSELKDVIEPATKTVNNVVAKADGIAKAVGDKAKAVGEVLAKE
jgi:hypothetical protein